MTPATSTLTTAPPTRPPAPPGLRLQLDPTMAGTGAVDGGWWTLALREPAHAGGVARRITMNRVALITGAASGIGRGLALALGRQGWRIAAVDCNAAGLQSLHDELASGPTGIATAVADVTEPVALADERRGCGGLGEADLAAEERVAAAAARQ